LVEVIRRRSCQSRENETIHVHGVNKFKMGGGALWTKRKLVDLKVPLIQNP
jgi:hypothetical protein